MTFIGEPVLGRRVMARLDELGRISDEPGRLTRLYLSPAHGRAVLQVRAWMEEAGMAVHLDAVGTVVGRYEGAEPGAPALLLGSHIDTVRDAGRYDGNLGVVAAIEAVAALAEAGERLPFAIEVLAFGDEEGVRFPTTLLGSRAVAGTATPAALASRDGDGISVAEALSGFGCDPEALAGVARARDAVLGYVELHIEQGPVLEAEELPVGIVTAINGATRMTVEVDGMAGHAGTVPMRLRRDALVAAAEMVLGIERRCAAERDIVGTVGQLEVAPGAINVIPGRVRFSIDLRGPVDAAREKVQAELIQIMDGICAKRGLKESNSVFYTHPACACAPPLMDQLAAAVARLGIRPRLLPSGAGHDGLAMVALCPIGMLFVRCRQGISHNPAESVQTEDVDVAVRVLLDFMRRFELPAAGGRSI